MSGSAMPPRHKAKSTVRRIRVSTTGKETASNKRLRQLGGTTDSCSRDVVATCTSPKTGFSTALTVETKPLYVQSLVRTEIVPVAD